ncbi:MAG: gas vesicle protein [Pseudomonadota bacterium]
MPEPSPTLRMVGPDEVLCGADSRLVDVVDRLLDAGVVVRGELHLTVADVDLVFVGANLVLSTPDRMQRDRMVSRSGASRAGETP